MRKKDAKLIKTMLALAAEREQRSTEDQKRLAAWLKAWAKELSR